MHAALLVFFSELSGRAKLRVPRVYWSFCEEVDTELLRPVWDGLREAPPNSSATGTYCCLLEDSATYETFDMDRLTAKDAVDIAEGYAALHAAFWECEQAVQRPCMLRQAARWAKRDAVEHARLEQGGDGEGTETEVWVALAARGKLKPEFSQACIRAAGLRGELMGRVQQHGATLVRNLADAQDCSRAPDGTLCMSGWDTVGVGCAARDVVLLMTSIAKPQQVECFPPMLDAYYSALIAGGVSARAPKRPGDAYCL